MDYPTRPTPINGRRSLHTLLIAALLACPSSAQKPPPAKDSPDDTLYGLDRAYVEQRVAAFTFDEPLPTPILAWFSLTDNFPYDRDLADSFHPADRELLHVVVAIPWATSAREASAPIAQQLCDVADDDVVRRGRLMSDAIRTQYAAFAGLIGTLLGRLTPDGAKRVDALVAEHWRDDAPTNTLVDWESLAMDTPAIVEGRTAGLCPTEESDVRVNTPPWLDQSTHGKTQ